VVDPDRRIAGGLALASKQRKQAGGVVCGSYSHWHEPTPLRRGWRNLIGFYEQLIGEHYTRRIPVPALGIEIATVGFTHSITGDNEKLRPFRSAQTTFSAVRIMEDWISVRGSWTEWQRNTKVCTN
jgi:hypothetical protein